MKNDQLERLLRNPVVKAYCRNLKKRGIKFQVIPMKPQPKLVSGEKHGNI